MKKASFVGTGFLTFAAVVLAVGTASAAALLVDNLNYSNGDIVGQGGWAAHSGAGVRPIQIVSGQAVESHGGSGEDVNKLFAGGARSATATTYACFEVSVTNPGVQTSDEYFAHFKDATFGFVSRLYSSPPAGGGDFRLAISATNVLPPAYWPSDLSFGQTYRLVISYDAATGTSKLWVDPTLESDPSVSNTDASAIGTLIEAFAMRQSSGGAFAHTLDNIRVAETFAEVCGLEPVPASNPAGLIAMGLLLLGGGTVFALRRRNAFETT